MTYEEIEVCGFTDYHGLFLIQLLLKEAYPEDFANRDDDKFNYRYRGYLFNSFAVNQTDYLQAVNLTGTWSFASSPLSWNLSVKKIF